MQIWLLRHVVMVVGFVRMCDSSKVCVLFLEDKTLAKYDSTPTTRRSIGRSAAQPRDGRSTRVGTTRQPVSPRAAMQATASPVCSCQHLG
mmetsp:Transcript_34865/g.40355  ORF Transcript_34865/g.40355 Transcript_34865/m.40355 type:complete len:90 (+) Transcript_34865:1341-1610(+)